MNQLTQAELMRLVTYDAETGCFLRAEGKYKGCSAGCFDHKGYVRIYVSGRTYLAHRLAWLYTYGVWPCEFIDHINRNPSDNRMVNLRAATRSINVRNSKLRSTNTSGYRGVSFFARERKWAAQLRINGKNIVLGFFDTPEKASQAYTSAAAKHGLEV